MNEGHAQLCSSPEWAEFIADEVVPAALAGRELSSAVLEIGPGYGAATARLAQLGAHLTAVEVDPLLAASLRERFPAVDVRDGRGEQLPFADSTFTSVVCFTMLHHVHAPAVQDELFAEAHRVLQPGGLFAGSDSIASPGLQEFHHDDVYTPVEPDRLAGRLEAVGFTLVAVVPSDDWFTFSAQAT